MLADQWSLLVNNMAKGDMNTYNHPVFPKGEPMGVGFHEAPRGVLSHWVAIDDGKIKNFPCVVPSTWIHVTDKDGGDTYTFKAK